MLTRREMEERIGDKGSRGSKIRCHALTSGSRSEVAAGLTELLPEVGATVTAEDLWMPDGFDSIEEAQLDKHTRFLGDENAVRIRHWWLASPRNATTPNWDIAATFQLAEPPGRGLLLVEAKAHKGELSAAAKSRPEDTAGSQENHKRIGEAIKEASEGLSRSIGGFALSPDRHYQLANRFGWAWKIASLGIPVVLMYLGFLHSAEMQSNGRTILSSAADWESTLKEHCRGVVPEQAWNRRIDVGECWVYPAIVARRVDLPE